MGEKHLSSYQLMQDSAQQSSPEPADEGMQQAPSNTHSLPQGTQTSPYLDTLNLGKVMLFLMNKVNFSASDNKAGLKNTSVAMCSHSALWPLGKAPVARD